MAITITPYNHTTQLFVSGGSSTANTWKLKLYSALTPNAAHTTLSSVDAAGTEATTGTGYTAGGQALTSLAATTVSTNGAKIDAADVVWTASGGPITAAYGVIYDDTHASDAPLWYINFDGSYSATDGDTFTVTWNTSGIGTVSVV